MAAANTAAAQGAGPYYEDDSVVVDLSVLDDGGRGKPPAALPPAGVVPGSSRSLMMPGTEQPRSRFHGLSGASPQVATKAAQPKRVATPKPKAEPKAPQMAEAKPAPAPKAAPSTPVTTQPAPPPVSTTPPPLPPISTPTPLPPAPIAAPAPAATDVAAAPAQPPAAPTIAPAPAPAAAPAPLAPPMTAPIVAPAPAAAPTPTITPTQPLSIAPPAAPVASVPVAPPAAKPAEVPSAAPSQAALPPATAPVGDRVMQVSFAVGESRIPSDAQTGLKELAERMKAKENLRMQLVAYAAGGDLSSSAARRLSLSRALAIRTLLIDNGVRSTRIDVRALGDKAPDEPANRVDVSLSER